MITMIRSQYTLRCKLTEIKDGICVQMLYDLSIPKNTQQEHIMYKFVEQFKLNSLNKKNGNTYDVKKGN